MLARLEVQEACLLATVFALHAFPVASNPFLLARLAMHAPAALMLWREQELAWKRFSAV